MYTSQTEQIQSPHAHTFVGLSVDQDGNCFAAERKGMRKTKLKGVVAYYPNPFRNPGPAELLYSTKSEAFTNILRDESGSLFVVGKTRIHTNAGEKWESKKTGNNLTQIWGIDGDMYLRFYSTNPTTTLLKKEGDTFLPTTIPFEKNIVDIAGLRRDSIYVSGRDGIAHFDGTKWTSIENAPTEGHLLCLNDNEVLTTGFWNNEAYLWQGNAEKGFAPLVKDCELDLGERFKTVCSALGGVYLLVTHGFQRGLWKLENDQVVRIMAATGYSDALAGNEEVLWVSNGIELLCTNGSDWIQVPRIEVC